jgi:MoaA/NifB/PqqE/SkfB family radical SAM enzyme
MPCGAFRLDNPGAAGYFHLLPSTFKTMSSNLKAWQRSAIRNTMANYRQAQADYYLAGKPLAETADGYKAFSLLTPPLGSPAARRRVKRIMENMLGAGTAVSARDAASIARTPHVATVAVTYDCQCDCLHCSASDYQETSRRERSSLSFDELRQAVGQVVDLGTTCVVFTGGEPLLHPRLCDLIAAVDPHQSVCTLFTNGELLTEDRIVRLKQAGIFGVFVSLDHSDPAEHDANRRRPGLADKAFQGIRRCQQAGILTGISTYATKEKIETGELDNLMDLARSLDVLEVFLFDVIPTGRLAARRDCMLTEGDARRIIDFRAKYSALPDYPRVIHQTMFASIAYPCVAEGCPAAMVQVHLRANGDVCPCDFTPRSFGNIRQRPLKGIWESMSADPLYAEPSARCRLSQADFWVKLEAVGAQEPAGVPGGITS